MQKLFCRFDLFYFVFFKCLYLLLLFLSFHSLLKPFPSGFCPHTSTITALLQVIDHFWRAKSNGSCKSYLIYLTAAFNSINHKRRWFLNTTLSLLVSSCPINRSFSISFTSNHPPTFIQMLGCHRAKPLDLISLSLAASPSLSPLPPQCSHTHI